MNGNNSKNLSGNPRSATMPVSDSTRTRKFVAALVSTALLTLSATGVLAKQADSEQVEDPVLQTVIDEAKAAAQDTYSTRDHALHDKLAAMDYQQYRAIRFRPERSLWKDEARYDVQLFHPGFLYDKPVTLHTISPDGEVAELPFEADRFRYDEGAEQFAGLTNEKNGYAGFRLHYPLNTADYNDEFAVFLGASYFRLVGKDQVYGLSARGLAIDTGLPSGEEFPYFSAFWLKQPDGDEPLTIYARLDSQSLTGAYAFEIAPGSDTVVKVRSWLFAREDVEKLGIAPFTSMFLYGENTAQRPDDYRPEVHDSDGVLMQTHTGERIWRPLTNPAHLQITSLSDTSPQGFGLLQRDQRWQNYLDSEANYHRRPGLWVAPHAGFDNGRLELVEIPTDSETHDNIVAYWVPGQPFEEGDMRHFAYTLSTVAGSVLDNELARVLRTRHGTVHLPGDASEKTAGKRRFTIDFSAPDAALSPDKVSLIADAANARIEEKRLFAVNDGKEWRATFIVTPTSDKPVDMRVHIASDQARRSEVWNYVYQVN